MRLFFMLLPWLELFSLIELGIQTSALTALLYVFGTFVLGLAILRRQGNQMLERVRDVQMGRASGQQLLVEDLSMGLAGLLLMIPGMITDFAAVIVLIGPLRRRLARLFGEPQVEVHHGAAREHHDEIVIEGQYSRVDDEDRR